MWWTNSENQEIVYKVILIREIIKTNDGSTTIYLPEWNESYHSKHGAIQEAYHVFIKNGLSLFKVKSIAILEIGFGIFINDNKIHRYLINYDDELHSLLTKFFKIKLAELSLSEIQIDYIINTICTYLLQNQYNYNYGIPKNYNDNIISENYKFKAIPYKGIDDPLYGSEISDPLLTQILTYFCYKYMNNSYRIHDYRLIINILEETSNFLQLKELFKKEKDIFLEV